MPHRNRARMLASSLVAALSITGCGASSDGGTASPEPGAKATSAVAPTPAEETSLGTPEVILRMSTRKGMTFEQDRLKASAGSVAKVVYTNETAYPHNVTFVDGAAFTDTPLASTRTITDDRATAVFVIPDQPGKYLFFCRVIGHGPKMNGLLHVR